MHPVIGFLPENTLRVHVLIGLRQEQIPVVVELIQELAAHPLVRERVDGAPDLEIVVDRTAVRRHRVVEVIRDPVGRGPGEGARDVVDVAAAAIVVGHQADGEPIGDHRDVQHALDRGARIAVGGGRIGGVDIRLDPIELRLVGDVAHHARLGACAEECSLGALEDLDALEIGGIDIEVTAGDLARLIVEVGRDVREAAGRAHTLETADAGRQATDEDIALTGANAAGGHVRQVLHEVIEGLDVELTERLGGQRLDGDRHVLDALGSALRGDDHFLQLVARAGRGCRFCRGKHNRRGRRTEDCRHRRGDLRIGLHRALPVRCDFPTPNTPRPDERGLRRLSIPVPRTTLE